MARTLRWATVEVIDDIDAVKVGIGNAVSGWSLVTSPAPPHGTRWIKKDGVPSNNIGCGTAEIYTPGARGYICQRGLIITGTLGSGDTIGILFGQATVISAFSLNALGQADGTFKLEVNLGVDGNATSSSTFAVGTGNIHNFRITFDGTNVTLEVNGSVEATQTSAAKPNTERGTLLASGKAGVAVYWNRAGGWSADSGADRPGVAIELDRLDPNAAGTDSGFGSEADCAAGTPNWNKWDDWASGAADDDTSYNCGQATEAQTSAVTTHTPTDNIEGVVVVSWQRANTDSKNVDTDLRIHDGTSSTDKDCPNQDNTSWWSQQRTFPLAPDGNPFDQDAVNTLQIGVVHNIGASNLHASSICAVLVSVNDDPKTEDRRRVLAQVA